MSHLYSQTKINNKVIIINLHDKKSLESESIFNIL